MTIPLGASVLATAILSLALSARGEEPLALPATPDEIELSKVLELADSFDSEIPNVLNDASLREQRINAHRPVPIATSHDSLLPPILRVEAQRLRGIILEAIEDYEGTRQALEVCIGLGDESVDNWQRLARARLHTGHFDQSEAAFLAAFQLSLARDGKRIDERAIILQELGELYLLTRQFEDARLVLNAAADLTPSHARILQLLERVDLEIAGEFGAALRTEQPLWPETRAQQIRVRIEHQLNRGFRKLPEALKRPLRRAGTFAINRQGREIGLLAVAGLALLMAIVRRLRGHGDLVIAIEFPHELRGSFTVRIFEQAGQYRRSKAGEDRGASGRESGSSRTTHQNVGRETQFQRLIPKIYYVVVDGVLMNPESGEILSKPFDEHAVEILKGETVRLEFDLQPRECPVDVHVLWDKHPTEEAGVAARGLPNSLRYTRAGATRLRLRKGKHTIVVGSGDRVAEREIDVRSYSPTTVTFDLAGSEGVVFKGCPPAVKPYLHGDHNSAARALSRDGHHRIASILLARLHRDLGQSGRAADYFEAAGQHLEAAELRATLQDYSAAALLFEEAGHSDRSAEMFREAGEWLRAGEAFESIEDFQEAAACFREANEVPRWLGALERDGAYFEAAQIALERSDRARAIRLLQLVPLDSPDYANACELLADAFEHEGHADLAAQKIEQRISAGEGSPDLQSRLGALLETSGEFQRALDTLESLRDDEPTYPNIATRIEGLRKRITAQSLSQTQNARSGPNTTAPTAFLAEKRYEILEELGRGGMGVVYKAKDLRLNREVALKRLPESLREHPKAIQLFLREAQACARLNHRNIVTIFDTDQDDNNFFITMELLQGYPLNVIRRQRGRIAVRDAARLGIQVAEGLHYAHSQGIVHRDIKTANLFFTTDKIVKIMDFGLAKMMEEVRRGTTVLGGTPYYMAPEQAQGGAVDQRADIYAFGVTLYELVTGGVPFTDGDIAYHHSHTPVTDPRERASGIGDEIAELILHMMEKNPDQRCASAEDVGRRLAQIANQPG
ncbi:MAG: protein kinase [Deltaproteobacteria bacterium]|nr:protein kinase [Deltaproteobacteria bacterium]